MARRERALDFGCGVGRHARLLAESFTSVTGVDVSGEMVRRARELHAGTPGLSFVVSDQRRLDGSYDLVHTSLVLQHLPTEALILAYVDELARVLAPGGLLYLQVPVGADARRRLQPRRRAYAVLRRAGVSPEALHRLGLDPVRMTTAAAERVESALAARGIRVLEAEPTPLAPGYRSLAYWATK